MLKANKTINYKDILVTEGIFNGDINNPKITFDGGIIEKEHFSPQQLQDIVDGKLKEGKCLVECKWQFLSGNGWMNKAYVGEFNPNIETRNVIKLNPHITIYPIEEKMYTKEDVMKYIQMYELSRFDWRGSEVTGIEIADKWFEQNVK